MYAQLTSFLMLQPSGLQSQALPIDLLLSPQTAPDVSLNLALLKARFCLVIKGTWLPK